MFEGYRKKVGGIQCKDWRDTGKRLEEYREKVGRIQGKVWIGYREKVVGI